MLVQCRFGTGIVLSVSLCLVLLHTNFQVQTRILLVIEKQVIKKKSLTL